MISRSLDGNRPLARIGEPFATRGAPADDRTPADAALVGYLIFTVGLGIGDTDIFDWAACSVP